MRKFIWCLAFPSSKQHLGRERQLDAIIVMGFRDELARARLHQERQEASIPDAAMHEDLVRLYQRLFEIGRIEVRTVLVIDLSPGESDAPALARGIAAHAGSRGVVAYWDPQAISRGR